MMRRKTSLKLLDILEKLGNFLPHPAIIFAILIIVLFVSSYIANSFGLSVIDPRDDSKTITIINLLSAEELVKFSTSLVKNFTDFPPLGVVLVAMLGISIAEASGFLTVIVRAVCLNAPKKFLTIIIIFTGILSNIASDVGYVVFIPLAAYIFHSVGRNPLAGIAAAFSGVSGGFSANILIGTTDPILSGITTKAAQILDPNYVVGVESNWYFMCASTFLIAIVGYFITEKIVEPRLGISHNNNDIQPPQKLSLQEKRALKYALFTLALYVCLILIALMPSSSLLRNPDTGSLIGSPFLKAIIFYVFLLFALPGMVYGLMSHNFKNADSIIEAMSNGMKNMSMVLVIIFFAAQFIYLFSYSHIGTFTAVKGAVFLQELNLDKGILLIIFIIISALINLSMSSASAQWAITSPIFVPMLMLLGYSPELIQAAYRIGDSSTNIITPLLTYLPIILTVAMRYQKNIGVGTMIAMMLPYSIAFLISWSALLYVWVFVFHLPIGPGAQLFYEYPNP